MYLYVQIEWTFPSLSNDVFMPRQCIYVLRGNEFLERQRIKSVRYTIGSISFLASSTWEILPKK